MFYHTQRSTLFVHPNTLLWKKQIQTPLRMNCMKTYGWWTVQATTHVTSILVLRATRNCWTVTNRQNFSGQNCCFYHLLPLGMLVIIQERHTITSVSTWTYIITCMGCSHGRRRILKKAEQLFIVFTCRNFGLCDTLINIACENIRFSSLFADGDVSRGGTSATQRQKFHTDDVKSVRSPVISADWTME